MKELLHLRIFTEYYHLVFGQDETIDHNEISQPVVIDPSTPLFEKIGKVYKSLAERNEFLFISWRYLRKYSAKEIQSARFFQMFRTRHFEPTGEECGTGYDEDSACPVCHAGAKQTSPLRLKRSRIPKADMAESIAWGEETVVSERFVQLMKENNITGLDFAPVFGEGEQGRKLNYYQVCPKFYLEFSSKTSFGKSPYDTSGREDARLVTFTLPNGKIFKKMCQPEIYKCPNGDNAGMDLLSEAYIRNTPELKGLDFFASRQTVGSRAGLIRQHHIFFCSNRMRQIILDNKLKGFKFEVAHIVDE